MAKFRRSPKFGRKHPCSGGSGGGPVPAPTGRKDQAQKIMHLEGSIDPQTPQKNTINHNKSKLPTLRAFWVPKMANFASPLS